MSWILKLRDSLQKKRNPAKESPRQYLRSVVAVIVFSAIVLVFVMFGYTGRTSQSGQLARVGNHYISIQEYRTEVDRMERMYAGMFGGQMNTDTQRQFFQNQALESLISQEVLYQAAAKNGIMVSDDEVRDLIFHDITAFQQDGRFDKERYFATLEANHFTAADFESKLKQEKVTEKLRELFDNSFVTDHLADEKEKSLSTQTRRFSWVLLDEEAGKKKFAKGKDDDGAKLWSHFEQKLEGDARKQDVGATEADLKEAGLGWTTDEANLAEDVIPKIASAPVTKRIFEIKADGQMAIIPDPDGKRKYLVQLKSSGTAPVTAKKDAPTATPGAKAEDPAQRSNEVFSAWLDSQKANIPIERNPTLLSSLR